MQKRESEFVKLVLDERHRDLEWVRSKAIEYAGIIEMWQMREKILQDMSSAIDEQDYNLIELICRAAKLAFMSRDFHKSTLQLAGGRKTYH